MSKLHNVCGKCLNDWTVHVVSWYENTINYLAHIRAIVARMSRDNHRELLVDECSTNWVDII